MPYSSSDGRPPAIADHLEPRARDVFREAFDHAWDEYDGDKEPCFRVARAAMKRNHHKRDGHWVPNSA